MDIQIKVINVGAVENVNKGRSSYSKFDLTYKDLGSGKVTGKPMFSFSPVYATLKDAKMDDVFTIHLEKNEKTGYWDWLTIDSGAVASESKPAATQSAVPRSNSNYENSEERKVRQRSIERQSSLAQAVNLLKTEKSIPAVEDVLKVAETFYGWVQGNPNQPLLDLENDDVE